MCVEVVIGGREFDRLGPLLDLLPRGVVASPAYADAALDPDACLCQIDVGATAERNGLRVVDPDDSMIRVAFEATQADRADQGQARACEICRGPLMDNDRIRRAVELWHQVDHLGNLHVYVDDANLEDCWFSRHPNFPDVPTAREVVERNERGAGPDQLAVEFELVGILEPMTMQERFAAYGQCWACTQREWAELEMFGEVVSEAGA